MVAQSTEEAQSGHTWYSCSSVCIVCTTWRCAWLLQASSARCRKSWLATSFGSSETSSAIPEPAMDKAERSVWLCCRPPPELGERRSVLVCASTEAVLTARRTMVWLCALRVGEAESARVPVRGEAGAIELPRFRLPAACDMERLLTMASPPRDAYGARDLERVTADMDR